MPVFIADSGKKYRICYDARSLNSFFEVEGFSYPTLREFASGLEKEAYMFSSDVKSAYHALKVPVSSQRYLCFYLHGEYYAFCAAPFGLSILCRIFQRLFADTITSYLRRVLMIHAVQYIDDLAGTGPPVPHWIVQLLAHPESPSVQQAAAHTLQQLASRGLRPVLPDEFINSDEYDKYRGHVGAWVAVALSCALGLTVSRPKCSLLPTRTLPFLGLIINTQRMGFDVPADKLKRLVDNVDQLLSFDHTSVRSLQKFTGRVQHLATVAPAARCYLRPLYDAVSEANGHLSGAIRVWIHSASIRESLTALRGLQRLALHHSFGVARHIPLRVYTDASQKGLGGWLEIDGAAYPWQAPVPAEYVGLPIHVLEALAVYMCLHYHAQQVANRYIDLYTDNEGVRGSMLHWSSACPYTNDILRALFEDSIRYAYKIRPYRVTTKDNVYADTESRTVGHGPLAARTGTASEVMRSTSMTATAFHVVQAFARELAGTELTIDICADELNHKLPRYYTAYWTPLAAGLNCLAQNLAVAADGTREFCYAFPPTILLPHVLQHLKESKSRAVLVYDDDAQLACYVAIAKHATQVRRLAPKGDSDTLVTYTTDAVQKSVRLRSNLLMAYCDFHKEE
jgi:hypothetical protein